VIPVPLHNLVYHDAVIVSYGSTVIVDWDANTFEVNSQIAVIYGRQGASTVDWGKNRISFTPRFIEVLSESGIGLQLFQQFSSQSRKPLKRLGWLVACPPGTPLKVGC
jgi:hypothetical protein